MEIDLSGMTLKSLGSPHDLTAWYQDGFPTIRTAVLLAGIDDLCLCETSGRLRIFSFFAQSFR